MYTLCIMHRSRLGPEDESFQNEADRSIFTSNFVFVLVKVNTTKTQNKVNFLTLHASKRACPTAI